jgi:WD40 repeat protein
MSTLKTLFLDDETQVCTYSPSSDQLATGTDSGSLYLWDLQSEKPGIKLRGHENSIKSIAYSTCGIRIATGSSNWIDSGSGCHIVRHWHNKSAVGEAGNWFCFAVVRGFSGGVNKIAWNLVVPLEFVTCSQDRFIRVWRIPGDNGHVSVGLVWTRTQCDCALRAWFSGVLLV